METLRLRIHRVQCVAETAGPGSDEGIDKVAEWRGDVGLGDAAVASPLGVTAVRRRHPDRLPGLRPGAERARAGDRPGPTAMSRS